MLLQHRARVDVRHPQSGIIALASAEAHGYTTIALLLRSPDVCKLPSEAVHGLNLTDATQKFSQLEGSASETGAKEVDLDCRDVNE